MIHRGDGTIKKIHQDDKTTLYLGNNLDVLPTLENDSIDAICTDPPYELKFMGRAWDGTGAAYNVSLWRECLRVLKPGGHLAAFGGTRTYHRLACAIEDAGFEIRDSLHWVYGSGFPKSLDVSKAIDKAAGAERRVIGVDEDRLRRKPNGMKTPGATTYGYSVNDLPTDARITAPATEGAIRWRGWGTALKPAHEPIVLARKPLTGTVAGNVLVYGTGALNIDATRVEQGYRENVTQSVGEASTVTGRWPTNVLLSHPPLLDEHGDPVGDACADGCIEGCPVAEMDRQSGVLRARGNRTTTTTGGGILFGLPVIEADYGPGDSGGASRFFPVFRYQAKAPSKERPKVDGISHPTVKPLQLMRWLTRLVAPPGGTVLDPFAGSGTTLEAAALEGFLSIGIESEEAYIHLCLARLLSPSG